MGDDAICRIERFPDELIHGEDVEVIVTAGLDGPSTSLLRDLEICTDLAPAGAVPTLPGLAAQPPRVGQLLDQVNTRFGAGTVALGTKGTGTLTP